MNNETNPYLRKLNQEQEVQKLFYESEWRLSFLRTQAEPTSRPTPEDICKTFTPTNSLGQRWN